MSKEFKSNKEMSEVTTNSKAVVPEFSMFNTGMVVTNSGVELEKKSIEVPVEGGRLLRLMSEAFEDVVARYDFTQKNVIPAADIEAYLKWLVAARVAYCSTGELSTGIIKLAKHPRDIFVPTAIYPILARIGRYTPTSGSYTIYPTLTVNTGAIKDGEGDAEAEVAYSVSSKGKGPKYLEGFSREINGTVYDETSIMRLFHRAGIAGELGLPMTKIIDDATLYSIVLSQGQFKGPEHIAPDASLIAVRAAFDFDAVTSIFGLATVSYAMESSLRTPVITLAETFTKAQ